MKDREERNTKQRGRIEIYGSDSLTAEGCLGVMLCTEQAVRLSFGSMAAEITGRGLVISSLSGQTVSVCGRIAAVEFI